MDKAPSPSRTVLEFRLNGKVLRQNVKTGQCYVLGQGGDVAFTGSIGACQKYSRGWKPDRIATWEASQQPKNSRK